MPSLPAPGLQSLSIGLGHLLLGPLVLEDRLNPEVTEPRGDCTSAGSLGPGSQVLCGCSKPNLLVSVEYDELLPNCLQTLLQVSILSKSTEREV